MAGNIYGRQAPGQENSLLRFARALLDTTAGSGHSHEKAVHQLLMDIAHYHRHGLLSDSEYYITLGKAIDVVCFFNYDPYLLRNEPNTWYRASIIHQIGQGMLQAIERLRPDLTSHTLFGDAMHGLGMGKSRIAMSCKQWAHGIKRPVAALAVVH